MKQSFLNIYQLTDTTVFVSVAELSGRSSDELDGQIGGTYGRTADGETHT